MILNLFQKQFEIDYMSLKRVNYVELTCMLFLSYKINKKLLLMIAMIDLTIDFKLLILLFFFLI